MLPNLTSIRSLLPLLRRHCWLVLGVIVLGILASMAEGIGISLFIPFLRSLGDSEYSVQSGGILDDVFGRFLSGIPPDDRLLVLSVCIVGSVVLRVSLRYGSAILSSLLDARMGHLLRTQLYEQFLTVGYAYIERSRSGDLLNALATETWRATEALRSMTGLIITASMLSVYGVLLVLISWKLSLLVAAVMLTIAAVVHQLTRRVKSEGETVTRINSALAVRMMESLEAMKLIRAFGREPYERHRFDVVSERASRAFFKLGVLSGVVAPAYQIMSAALLVSILFISLQTPSSLPPLLVFIFVLYRLQPIIQSLDSVRIHLMSLMPSIEKVLSILNRADKLYIRSGTTPFRRLTNGIRFDQVGFRYGPNDAPALRNVSFQIPAGRTTALVGPSGAGKSTLIKLVLRLYDAQEGTIYVDGEPLDSLNLDAWRSRIALVSQDVYVFNATVRDNIAYGRLDATDEEIVEAAKLADAHGFISRLPFGYDTEVGDRGTRLSGGQRQRLTLARAIVRDPDILILDEATNSLDTLTEHLIQETLLTLGQDRTVVIIAHRLSTIERAEHVVVLEEGGVREQGDLRSLLELDGLFARLYNVQHRTALDST